MRAPALRAVAGWGESHRTWARAYRPETPAEAAAILADAREDGRRVALRGGGRSYGDASVLSRETLVDLSALTAVESVDAQTGEVQVQCGVTIDRLWRACLPHGFWPAVVPGTSFATVGGCISMNVHGKNNVPRGVFGDHLAGLELVVPGEAPRWITQDEDPELFRAVCGGLGLLGLVTRARIRTKPVHSGLLEVEADTVSSLGELLHWLDERCEQDEYVVGWLDAFDHDGRGVMHAGRHLPVGADPDAANTLTEAAQELPPRLAGVVPRGLAWLVLWPFGCPTGMRLINLGKYRSAWFLGRDTLRQAHAPFHFLLDHVPGWKRIYHPGGLIQYQSFVPADAAETVFRRQLELCREADHVSWLAVVKRHRSDDYLLSHAVDGYSLALDFPVTAQHRESLWDLCRRMDDLVLDAGGRMYLAKDSTTTPENFARAYPGLGRFRELRERQDPDRVLVTDQSLRLGI